MKKVKVALWCLALLLVSATSSFALAVVDTTTVGTSGVFTLPGVNNTYYNSQLWTENVVVPVGTSSAVFNMGVTLNGAWNTSITSFQALASGVNGAITNIYTPNSNLTPSIQIPITLSGAGTYTLSAQSIGALGNDASWTINSASVTTTPSKTPIPAAALLLGSGILGLFGVNKARKGQGSDA